MNRELFESILIKKLSKDNVEKILKVINNIFLEYGEDFKIPALSDNTELYLIKDKSDYFTLESFLLNRIIRNIYPEKAIKDNDPNIEATFLNYLHIKNYVDYLKMQNEINSIDEFNKKFDYLEDMKNILSQHKVKYILSKKDLKENLKNISLNFLEKNKEYKKRAGEEDIEISNDTSIEEVIFKSKKKYNAKEIRNAIERDKELLRFEEETRKRQEEYPEGINAKQIEKANFKKHIKQKYIEDINLLLSQKYNVYLFSNLNALTKLDNKYVSLFINKVGKKEFFENIFLESSKAYEIFENKFKDKIKSLNIPGSEGKSAYYIVNRMLNEIEYGNETTNKISMSRLNLIFLEELSEDLEKEYTEEKGKQESKEKQKTTEETIKEVKKEDSLEEFAETVMGDYLLTENKYQVSRRNEDEEYFVDIINNLLAGNINIIKNLIPSNNLYDKNQIRTIIRMLITAKLISFENIEEKNYLKKILNIEEIQKILKNIKNNPYILALNRVAEHAKFARGTEEITRLEHDRKRLDDNLKYINNTDFLIKSYEKLVETVKEYKQDSFTLNAKKDQILSKVEGNITEENKDDILEALISLIKIIARQNNMYPTEEIKNNEGYTFNIDKKYVTYVRTDLINEIEKLLEDKKAQNRKYEKY